VNAPLRPDATPRLEDFPYRLSDNVRFADLDPNQHVNNAVYATYFETGRVTLMKDRSYGLMPDGLGWIMVRIDIHFRAELHWPGQIELGLGVAKVRPHLGELRSGGVLRRQMRSRRRARSPS
jgi:acyl-CoA thioester hydrolase